MAFRRLCPGLYPLSMERESHPLSLRAQRSKLPVATDGDCCVASLLVTTAPRGHV